MAVFEGAMTKRAKSRVGRVLKDKWRLDRLLGVGGTAAVYAARHRNGQKVALKMLHTELSEVGEVRARFLREGYVANRVEHPGALAVLDDDVDEDGTVFLVTELLDGETLNDRWKAMKKAMNPAEVLQLADQVLAVLEAAHGRGIVHRDIKPENLFLTNDGQVKVLDFGIARMKESLEAVRVTQTGTAVGTPAFMAPEQARGRSELIDGQTDLWAVGATMFTLLSGRIVHEAQTGNEQLLAAMMRPARSLATVTQGLPTAIVEIVDRALQFEKEARYPTANDMRLAVRTAYAQITGRPLESAAKLVPSKPDMPSTSALPAWEQPSSPVLTRQETMPRFRAGVGRSAVAWGGLAGLGVVVVFAALRFAPSSQARPSASAPAPPVDVPSVTFAPSAPPAPSTDIEFGEHEGLSAPTKRNDTNEQKPSQATAAAGSLKGSKRRVDPGRQGRRAESSSGDDLDEQKLLELRK